MKGKFVVIAFKSKKEQQLEERKLKERSKEITAKIKQKRVKAITSKGAIVKVKSNFGGTNTIYISCLKAF